MRSSVALRIYHKCGSALESERDAEAQRLVGQWSSWFRSVEASER